MIRPAVIGTCLAGVLGAGAFTAVTHAVTPHRSSADHQICIVLAKDPNHQHTQDYCIDWTGVLR